MRLPLFLTLVLSGLFGTAFSQCEAVLQTGVFDTFNVLDERAAYTLVKQVARAETATFTPVPGLGEILRTLELSGAFDQPFAAVRAGGDWARVQQASLLINSNWLGCVRVNTSGLSHFVTPVDETRFVYRLNYTPNGGATSIEVAGLGVAGARCGDTLVPGTRVTRAGVSLSCERTTPDTTAALTLHGVSLGSNIAPIVLRPLASDTVVAAFTPGAAEVCLRHSQIGANGLLDSGWQCSSGEETGSIFLGDGTGYRAQSMSILTYGEGTEVCFRQGSEDTEAASEWVCSSAGLPSPYAVLGNDGGFQTLDLRVTGPGTACLRYRRAGQDYSSCWSEDAAGEPIPLGANEGVGERLLWLEFRP